LKQLAAEEERQKRIAAEWERREQLEQQVGLACAPKRHSRTPVGAVPIMPGIPQSPSPREPLASATPEETAANYGDDQTAGRCGQPMAEPIKLPEFNPAATTMRSAATQQQRMRNYIALQTAFIELSENTEHSF
uniref:CCDC66 domain-containing protein n=1 Tax=Anisakis simplex TaxID=6269 RepID=A0A0M3JAN6_ANISI